MVTSPPQFQPAPPMNGQPMGMPPPGMGPPTMMGPPPGYPPYPIQQAPPPGLMANQVGSSYDVEADSQGMGGHSEYPNPKPWKFTTKEIVSWVVAISLVNQVIGGFISFKLYDVTKAILEAIANL